MSNGIELPILPEGEFSNTDLALKWQDPVIQLKDFKVADFHMERLQDYLQGEALRLHGKVGYFEIFELYDSALPY